MTQQEILSIRAAYGFYAKWRGKPPETNQEWNDLALDVGVYAAEQDTDRNPLAWHLLLAVLETLNIRLRDGGEQP